MELLRVEAGRPNREEDEERDRDRDFLQQQFSRCPACQQQCECDNVVLLILPCSHTLCGPCIAAGEGIIRSNRPHGMVGLLPVCSVLCPRCRHPVELPCFDWSSAVSCLPKHPTLSPDTLSSTTACVSTNTEGIKEGPSQYHPPHGQDNTYCLDADDVRAQSSSHGSQAATTTSSLAPADGAIDLREEEMEQSVFGLSFALDPSTAPPSLQLSNSALTVAYQGVVGPAAQPPPHNNMGRGSVTFDPSCVTQALPQVRANVVITRGQYYWEVDVCNSSVYRIGVSSLDGSGGWWLERLGPSFCAVWDGAREPLCTVPPQIKTLGLFLNVGGGALSFHNPLTQEHLATLPTRFNPAAAGGLLPALSLGQGRLRLRCVLPPPPHVFLCRDSAYRGPMGAGGGHWHREIPFRSVRKVIQKFEELAGLSDSDSGLVSSLGSSCSTLASLPDTVGGNPGMMLKAGQEPLAE